MNPIRNNHGSILPINGRNFQSLIPLIPGVVPSNASVGIFDNPQGTQFFQVNGQNNSANNYQIDGVDNNEPLLGLVVQIPPAEAIQQFSVSTSNYDAEFGRAVGAVINVAKSIYKAFGQGDIPAVADTYQFAESAK